jgi:hypothetical protein
MNDYAAMDPSLGAAHVDVATFRTQCDTTFFVIHDGDQVPLLLAEVADGPAGGGIERFSLFFHGPADRVLTQGTYEFEHDALGSLTLFIVPILGSTPERIVYEASFVRSAPQPSTR